MPEADAIVHFAAESHNDNSIADPAPFVRTNVEGRSSCWRRRGATAPASTTSPPTRSTGTWPWTTRRASPRRRPYQAVPTAPPRLRRTCSCARGPHLRRARHHFSNCSNNYGPRQHIEKFIPRQITNILSGARPKLYGDGLNVRDWIHTEDHSSAVWAILTQGVAGETYLIGADGERKQPGSAARHSRSHGARCRRLRLGARSSGHDRRYAIDSSKLRRELGWRPRHTDFSEGLDETIRWYRDNEDWWRGQKEAVEAKYASQGTIGEYGEHGRADPLRVTSPSRGRHRGVVVVDVQELRR